MAKENAYKAVYDSLKNNDEGMAARWKQRFPPSAAVGSLDEQLRNVNQNLRLALSKAPIRVKTDAARRVLTETETLTEWMDGFDNHVLPLVVIHNLI
jgi:hypothetical protein